MPEFLPGESKIAIVTMSNPTVKAFDYVAELYMGTNLVLMASADFHLEAGEAKDISLPVTMPSVAGTYPVYIGVFSSGVSIGLYKATDDVVIAAPALPQFYMPANLDVRVTDGGYVGMYWRCSFSCSITNKGNAPGSYTVRWQQFYNGTRFGSEWYSTTITLNPGETYNWSYWFHIDFRRCSSATLKLYGGWEGDNYAEGVATKAMTV